MRAKLLAELLRRLYDVNSRSFRLCYSLSLVTRCHSTPQRIGGRGYIQLPAFCGKGEASFAASCDGRYCLAAPLFRAFTEGALLVEANASPKESEVAIASFRSFLILCATLYEI